ncbi:MAG: hypothetical protein AAGD05_00650 [Bacteroidota bacterium]
MIRLQTLLNYTFFFFLLSTPIVSFAQLSTDLNGPACYLNPDKEVTKTTNASASLFDHFQTRDIVELELRTNITQLLKNKKTNNYQTADLSWTDPQGMDKSLEIRIRPRGKTRRKICSFPPLKLKFKKSVLSEKGFAPVKNLKLVAHCLDDELAEENLLKEYLAYKIYNELTDNSFRVQLLKVNYVDSQDGQSYGQKYAFLIESSKELEQRLGAKKVNQFNTNLEDLQSQEAQQLAIFQYLIGNTDWKVPFMHNIKLFKVKNSEYPIAVPYDFDFSGLVNASYAKTSPDYKQKSVRQRIYLGANRDFLPETLQMMSEKKDAIYALINNFGLVDAKVKTDLIAFLDAFYETISDQKAYKKAFKPLKKRIG